MFVYLLTLSILWITAFYFVSYNYIDLPTLFEQVIVNNLNNKIHVYT